MLQIEGSYLTLLEPHVVKRRSEEYDSTTWTLVIPDHWIMRQRSSWRAKAAVAWWLLKIAFKVAFDKSKP